MFEPRYQLVPESAPKARRRVLLSRTLTVVLMALTLIVTAAYGPALFQEATATARPALPAYSATATGAQPAQILDSSLLTDQEALASLYDAVSGAVVNIQVVAAAGAGQTFEFPFPMPEGELPQQRGQGSGFIYDDQGHIVTNNHVVEDAQEVTVLFADGSWADAEIVATDPQADLAVIRVTPPEGIIWRPLALAEPDTLRVGHQVIAIGNPFGLDGTMTTGIVSAIGRGMPIGDFGETRYTLPEVIQTDAAINPGNSGGPLLNLRGEVVGVNFAIESPVRSNSGVGFTIPVSIVRRVVPALIENGAYEYAYLGLSGATISPALARELDLPNTLNGAYVSSVVEDGPAAAAGIVGGSRTIESQDLGEFQVGGDIVTAIDSVPVERFEDLVGYLVTKASPGQAVTLTVLRSGEELQVPVTLGERPSLSRTPSLETEEDGEVNARRAIEIAMQEVEEQGLLDGPVVEKVATPDEYEGRPVWLVELSSDTQTATILVDRATGEVVQVAIR